ncbi:hypothetical protein [Primorskyibacter sp. S187A]|uniref:hypothetical protein n=1 Tax=Primorskyibacter sp. S187A TaxID=3415130 RepID=UPI003C7C8E36
MSAYYLKRTLRDAHNIIRYGRNAPLGDGCLYIDPARITHALYGVHNGKRISFRQDSARVLGGDWDMADTLEDIEDLPKMKACRLHFQQGHSWHEAGAYRPLMHRLRKEGTADFCNSLDDIKRRYQKIDRLYKKIGKRRAMKTRQQLGYPAYWREFGGIFVHIARDGRGIMGGGGMHRLAIAKILELDVIPIRVGRVHEEAVKAGLIRKMRWRKLMRRRDVVQIPDEDRAEAQKNRRHGARITGSDAT